MKSSTTSFGSWTNNNYPFLGWARSSTSTVSAYSGNSNINSSFFENVYYKKYSEQKAAKSIDLYAVWQAPKKVKVVFNKNDETGAIATQQFTAGTKGNKFGYNTDGTPKWKQTSQFGNWDRTGYKLLGWSTIKSDTKAMYNIYSGVTDNWINSRTSSTITLYAIWAKEKSILSSEKSKTITVKFYKNDGTNIKATQSFTLGVKGNKFGYNTDGTPKWKQTGQFGNWDREGYELLGWSTNKNTTKAAYSIYSNVNDNWINSRTSSTVTLYAIWVENVDVALFIGQSNMVGYADHRIAEVIGKSQGTKVTDNEKQIAWKNFAKKYEKDLKNIGDDILKNTSSFAYTKVSMPTGVAFEYKYLENELIDISTNPTTFGEKLVYNSNNKNIERAQSNNLISSEASKGTNIIPYFAERYYKNTGRKLVIVHVARSGRPIYSFLPYDKCLDIRKNVVKLQSEVCEYAYETMVKKYQKAEAYLEAKNYKVKNKFYVVYQGEFDSGNSNSAKYYEANLEKLHKQLTETGLKLSFGAVIHTVREGNKAPYVDAGIEQIHTAKENLIKKYRDKNNGIILGSRFAYEEYSNGNKSLFIPNPNNMHLHSAALSRIGRDTAINVSNYIAKRK